MREDFYEIVGLFQKNNKMMVADSASNGQMTDRIVHQVIKILEANKHQTYSLGLSLDGFKEFNDQIRGKGTFDQSMKTWIELKKIQRMYNNFEPYVCTTMNTINQSTMNQFIEWCVSELKPTKVSLIKIRQNPRDGDYLKKVEYDHYKNCAETIAGYTRDGLMGDINKPQTYLLMNCYERILETIAVHKRQFTCYAGQHGGFVDYKGDVGVCEVLPSIGNLRDAGYDFPKMWNSIQAGHIRQQVCHHDECEACTHESEGLLPSMLFPPHTINM